MEPVSGSCVMSITTVPVKRRTIHCIRVNHTSVVVCPTHLNAMACTPAATINGLIDYLFIHLFDYYNNRTINRLSVVTACISRLNLIMHRTIWLTDERTRVVVKVSGL